MAVGPQYVPFDLGIKQLLCDDSKDDESFWGRDGILVNMTTSSTLIWILHVMNTTDMWACDLCNFSGSLMGKTQEKRQSKAQYANMPVVATVFIGKWALISTFDSQKGGLALIG